MATRAHSVALEIDSRAATRLQASSVALELEFRAATRLQASSFALEIEYNPYRTPIATITPGVSDPPRNQPYTFLGAGDGTIYRWAWTTRPGASVSARNVDPTAMADAGGTSFLSMANNAVLYHTENVATDSSGNANTATLSNITYTTGQVGTYAWSFDTVAAEATIGTQVTFAGGNWTYAFWAYDLGADGGARSAGANAARTDIPLRISTSNRLGLVLASVEYLTTIPIAAASYTGWHHWTVTATAGYTSFYIDGVYVGAVQQKSTSNLKYIGNNSTGSQRFAARLDEVAAWTRTLSAAEVNALFVNQKGAYAYDASTGYAAVAQNFTFTPDRGGAHVIENTVLNAGLGGVSTAAASLDVRAGGGGGVIQGERLQRLYAVGQRLKPTRGQKP